ncbi:UDP-N-acetylmuramate dehydrogenase [Allorhizocola rhizosphaerae]|uniref:UDP-N-acetylmuramate dehydrogenase n=1 Tax=Allorhizocola rhizosphaerae TaxID=1872709 RepID=UPI000E3E6E87|nr:UDP-N-acetylmuramate dehydrogenase [Allorhizocola rhizosphaerae]
MSDDSLHTLSAHTTLGLGGPAAGLIEAKSIEEMVSGVQAAARDDRPLLVLGGGSNVVIADDGFPGTALLVRSSGFSTARADAEHVLVRVEAGQHWDEFVAAAVEQGWSGAECLSGIPGLAGGTPIQNVGAYGQEVSETIVSVTVYDRDEGAVQTFTNEQCRFEYRNSVFKRSQRWVVLDVTFRLRLDPLSAPISYAELAKALDVPLGQRVPLRAAREAVLEIRRRKGMVLDPSDPDTRSVGSFFTNPVLSRAAYREMAVEAPAWPGAGETMKVSAAWLIENSGFHRGYRRGAAAISSKHTLALTNPGNGTTADLLALAAEIRAGVLDRFGVTLHPEPVLVNCAL